MTTQPGIITLMGSGEMTAAMVEVHKELLGHYGPQAGAVFIDTPAGFQLNADQIAQKAKTYFQKHIQHPLTIASLKSADQESAIAKEQCYQTIQQAQYLFIGPGSPTYALRQWQQTRIPELLAERVAQGACLVAASAAALTMGQLTLPVYEIYKVGHTPHWVEGLNLFKAFGLDWTIIPHWNNAEGGNHDTRYCFMGAPRLQALETLLPDSTTLVGLDEHTALVINFATQQVSIKGLGSVTLRQNGRERIFSKNDAISLTDLCVEAPSRSILSIHTVRPQTIGLDDDMVWAPVEGLSEQIHTALAHNRIEAATHALLELERHIHEVYEQLQARDAEGAAREVLRNLLVLFGSQLARRPDSRQSCLAPLVDALLELRSRLKEKKEWQAADEIRACLARAGVQVEDRSDGMYWRLVDKKTGDEKA
ncbi:MAG: Type 1 glutamine amidotransferase-like domain-containing protein [Desulfobacteraceae bacterium]|nr:Type 1 glutamine amidotransferase-like domain-containing protein [Desulfobacteraceae bacterium]